MPSNWVRTALIGLETDVTVSGAKASAYQITYAPLANGTDVRGAASRVNQEVLAAPPLPGLEDGKHGTLTPQIGYMAASIHDQLKLHLLLTGPHSPGEQHCAQNQKCGI